MYLTYGVHRWISASNTSALAMELCLSCTRPSIWSLILPTIDINPNSIHFIQINNTNGTSTLNETCGVLINAIDNYFTPLGVIT